MVDTFYWICVGLFIFVCVILMLLVLIQKGRGGGLASAFGGGGGNTAFGSKTGDVLTWATSVVFGVFILLAVALNLVVKHQAAQRSSLLAPAAPTVPLSTPAGGGSAPAGPANPAPAE